MGKAWVIGFGGCVVLAGCGTVLAIQPDSSLASDGGLPGSDGSSGDGAAFDETGAPRDGSLAPIDPPCAHSAATASCELASGLSNLGGIAVGNGNVYFTRHENPGGIYQVPTVGGDVAPFAIGSMFPAGLSATTDSVFWVTEGDFQIVHQGFDAGMPSASTYGLALPAAQIVGVGLETFWTVPGSAAITNGQVRATALFNAGSPIALNEPLPTALAADADYVYFANKGGGGKVVRMSHSGSMRTEANLGFSDVTAIALSKVGIVAITSADGVFRASTMSDVTFASPWEKISSNTLGVGAVADDLTGTVYVLAANGALESIPNVPTPQLTTTSLASCPVGTAIAHDASHVYLACKDTIVRVPK